MEHKAHFKAEDFRQNIKYLSISFGLIGLFFFAEITVALITGSVVVLADSFHSLSAVFSIGLALSASYYAGKPPTRQKTYGYLRGEIIAAFLNGLLLFGMAAIIFYQGITRIIEPVAIPPLPLVLVALGGIVTEVISLAVLYKGQKTNINIRGAFWHILNTFFGSFAILITALFIYIGDIFIVDPIAAMIFGVVLLVASYRIIKDSVVILLDVTPGGVDLKALEEKILSLEEVEGIHHTHAWVIATNLRAFSAHVVVADMNKSGQALKKTSDLAKDNGFALTTIQVEPKDFPEEQPDVLEYKKPS